MGQITEQLLIMTKKQKKILADDEVMISLKERYFKLYSRENIGKTPELTQTLDNLETVIKERKKELLHEN